MMDESVSFRRYLLGELDESAQEAFERKLMTSDELFQELLIAEDELVDDYCAGHLSETEAEKYRERFLVTPERRVQHRFGAALRRHFAANAVQKSVSPAPKFGRGLGGLWGLPFAAAAAALLIVLGLWFIVSTQRSPLRLEETARLAEGSRAAFFLMTDSLRSVTPDAGPIITVPSGVPLVELQLDLPSDARGDYDVRIEDVRDGAVLAEGSLPARTIEGQWVVVATVPSDALIPGDYRVSVGGAGDALIRTYEFRVRSP